MIDIDDDINLDDISDEIDDIIDEIGDIWMIYTCVVICVGVYPWGVLLWLMIFDDIWMKSMI